MTEPADGKPETTGQSPPAPSGPGDVLDTFKADPDASDEQSVHDAIGGRPRLNWSPVTDGGGGRATADRSAEDRSNFHFDLGGALARLGGQDAEPERGDVPPPPPTSLLSQPTQVEPPQSRPLEQLPLRDEQLPQRAAAPVREVVPESSPLPSVPVVDEPLPQRAAAPVREVVPESPPLPSVPVVDEPLPQRAAAPVREVVPESPLLPSVPVVDEPLPQRAAAPVREVVPEPPPLEPLPRRGERLNVEAPPVPEHAPIRESSPAPQVTARRSVFDDGAQTTQPAPPVAPVSDRAPSLPVTPVSPGGPTPSGIGAVSTGVVADSPLLPAAAAAPLLPTLPAAKPVSTPMYTPPIDSAPSAPDINALRAAQLRASRQQRHGKLFGRTLLSLLLVGGLIAAALVFGRRYLFPTEWDSTLTPIVDSIQTERGVEFDHTVGLVKQPAGDYALTIGRIVVDDGWLEQVPMWRALGLASGEPTADGVAPAIAADRLAVYDPDADRIYMSADADPTAAAADLRLALEQAFAAQQGVATAAPADEVTRFTGVSPRPEIVDAAIEAYLAQRTAPNAANASAPAADAATGLPLPIEYEIKAIDDLGEGLLASAGVDPATVTFESGYPDTVGDALDDAPRLTAGGALQVGDRTLASPTALGVDDWSLVWGAHLPEATVDQLTRVVVGDSYRPIDRAGALCAIGDFEADSAADAAYVLSAMQTWVAAAPPAAQATTTPVGDTRVQLTACDPGAEASTVPQAGVVDALINRQLVRLAST